MANLGRQAAVGALLLGGVAVLAPIFFSGTPRLAGYGSLSGSYGGMMGGHGGMMGGYGGMMGGYGGMMGGYGGMMGGYGGLGGFGTGWSIFGMLGQLGFLLLLVGGGYLLYRALVDDGGTRQIGNGDTAMQELRRAYARGELSDEQFESRRKRLRRGGDP